LSAPVLTVCLAIIITCVIVVTYIIKNEKSAVVKGSILIINSLNSHSIIISLRSIRKVKTKSVLGMYMTKINYSLDGNKNIIRFIGRSHTLPVKPDVLLNNAIKRVKKKGKS